MYLNPQSRQNNSPKPLSIAQKAIILPTFGVQVRNLGFKGLGVQGLGFQGFRVYRFMGLRIQGLRVQGLRLP